MALFTNLQPAAGQPIAADTTLQFDAIDPLINDIRIFVWVSFAATGQVELAYDSANFQPLYSASQITTIGGGLRFFVRRSGGWPSTPALRVDSSNDFARTKITIDSRGTGASTGLIAAAGTGTGSIDVSTTKGTLGYLNVDVSTTKGTLGYLNVSADTVTDGRIKFYADVARTKLIYEAPAAASPDHDFTTAFVDRTPAYLLADDGTDLESESVHYSITNSGASDATFTIKMIVIG
jgi:hypothetical protein